MKDLIREPEFQTKIDLPADADGRDAHVRQLLNEVYEVFAPNDLFTPDWKPSAEGASPLAALKERIEDRTADGDRNGKSYAGARLDSCVEAANFVKSLRARSGLTQKQLSELSGVQQATISNIERVRVKDGPRISTLGALARACGYEFRLKI